MTSLLNDGKPFRFADHQELGLKPHEIFELLEAATIRRLLTGVYCDTEVQDSRQLRIRAAQLIVPPHAVLCSETAAWVHGLDVWPSGQRHTLKPHFVVPHGSSRIRQDQIQARQAILPEEDFIDLDGLLITTIPRTVVDLLRRQWRPRALASADAFCHSGLISTEQITDRVALLKGFPGIRQARALSQLIDPLSESFGESVTRLRLIDAGFPAPLSQFEITDVEGIGRRLDMCYRASKLAIEFDGREFHSGQADRDHDEHRRRMIEARGFRFVIATSANIFGEDMSFEEEVGRLIGKTPRPRVW